jgi:hypothetical protein
MGHSAVPGHFQYCINGVLHKHKHFAFSFADDIIVGANSLEDLKANTEAVLRELMRVGFRVNSKKCQLYPREEITYLGWVISKGQMRPAENTLAKLCLAKLIPENLEEATLELSMQWLIQPEKTVPKVMAIRMLYHYHSRFPWVVEPLRDLMQKDFSIQSPGLQNTIRKISKLLAQEGK